jgi:Flp pilus assembly protein TadG
MQRRYCKVRRGVAAVELAVLLPFLMFVFVIAVDFSRVFYFSIVVASCARNGAIYGSADAAHALGRADIQIASQADAKYNLNLSQLIVSSTTDNPSNPTWVQVTVTYPFTTVTKYPGVPSQMTLTRTVQMQVVPATPTFP